MPARPHLPVRGVLCLCMLLAQRLALLRRACLVLLLLLRPAALPLQLLLFASHRGTAAQAGLLTYRGLSQPGHGSIIERALHALSTSIYR